MKFSVAGVSETVGRVGELHSQLDRVPGRIWRTDGRVLAGERETSSTDFAGKVATRNRP